MPPIPTGPFIHIEANPPADNSVPQKNQNEQFVIQSHTLKGHKIEIVIRDTTSTTRATETYEVFLTGKNHGDIHSGDFKNNMEIIANNAFNLLKEGGMFDFTLEKAEITPQKTTVSTTTTTSQGTAKISASYTNGSTRKKDVTSREALQLQQTIDKVNTLALGIIGQQSQSQNNQTHQLDSKMEKDGKEDVSHQPPLGPHTRTSEMDDKHTAPHIPTSSSTPPPSKS